MFYRIIIHIASDIHIKYYTHLIYLLTAILLTPGGSSTVRIYTQTIHRTTQHKQYTEHNETEYPERNIHYNNNS